MRYAELVLPPSLQGWAASVWTLDGDGNADEWHGHEATPDGCVELIHRAAGRSEWRRPQPAIFATGLSEQPIAFRFTGDAVFTGIKLWPWAWLALGGPACPSFADDWLAIDAASPLANLFENPPTTLANRLSDPPPPIAAALAHATSVADLSKRTGYSHRQLQRAFATTIGLPPRRYLRLLRFRATMLALSASGDSLAGTAAERGYADHAHMARDFRIMAGTTPSDVRHRAQGPFL